MIVKYMLPLVAVGLLGFAVYFVSNSRKEPAQAAPLVEPARSPFTDTVAAAGIVEPQSEDIAVGSQVAGIVVKVFVQVGDKVRPQDPLFSLDDRQLQAELVVRQAALKAAEAELLRLEKQPRQEQIPVSVAQVREAEANLASQKDQYDRTRQLQARGASSEQELNTRLQAFRVAQSQLARAQAELDLVRAGAWEYDKETARVAVAQAAAQIDLAKTEIDRLTIGALVEGEVLQVKVRPGEFVGGPASQPLILLGSVNQLHVRVDIDEHDISRFVPGTSAEAAVKGNPEEKFPLKFVRVEPYVVPKQSLTGQNTERVDTRVLQVIYALDPGKKLYVGQQLDVFIDGADPAATTAAR